MEYQKSSIRKCNISENLNFLQGGGGFKMKILYKKLLEEFTENYKVTAGYIDENINYALTIHEGDSIPVELMLLFIQNVSKMFSNIQISYQEKYQKKTFIRFPRVINDMTDLVINYLI